MQQKIRKFLSNKYFIHAEVFLAFFALFGYLAIEKKFLIFFVALSFAGAVCGSFIKVIDTIKENK